MKVNLILGSGGIKGFALVGVLKALTEAGIKPDKVAGVSVGSLIGAFYTNDISFKDIGEWFVKVNFIKELRRPLHKIIFDTVKYKRAMPLFQAKPFVFKVIHKEKLNFKNNFYVVVANRSKRKTESYNLNLAEANPEGKMSYVDLISASMSMPAAFKPVFINNQRYCDGGTYKGNCPVDVFTNGKNVMNIAVQISKPSVEVQSVGVFGDFLDAYEGAQWELYREQIEDSPAEILIEPDCGKIMATDFGIGEDERYRLIQSGYFAALEALKVGGI